MQTFCPSSNRTTPALSRKTLTHQSFAPRERRMVSVAANTVSLSRFSNCTSRPGSMYFTRPRSVLCEQCSLQVCARVSSSMSVGSRPSVVKYPRIACISAGCRYSCPSRLRRTRSSSDIPRIGTVTSAKWYCDPRVRLDSVSGPSTTTWIASLAITREQNRDSSPASQPASIQYFWHERTAVTG